MFIEGENLEVLRVLQKSYFGKVKMIYIDPPYNTGNDSFVYPDDYSETLEEYQRRSGERDEAGYLNKQSLWKKNSKESGHYHSAWLSMVYPRLYLARNLLREDGVIFISIDDNEIADLMLLCDEVFGNESFIAKFPWRKRTAKSDVPSGVSQDFEWVICYQMRKALLGVRIERKYFQTDDFPGDRWRLSDLTTQRSASERPNCAYEMIDPKTGKGYLFNPNRVWGVSRDSFLDYYSRGKIVFPGDYDFLNISIPAYRVFESEDQEKSLLKYGFKYSMKAVSTLLPSAIGMSEDGNSEMSAMFGGKIFSFPKPVSLIRYFVDVINDKDCVILDFFAGSGTTAQAVMELNLEDGGNRQCICVQMPEVLDEGSEARKAGYRTIADITRARIDKVIAKLKAEQPDKTQDLACAQFTLAPSNFQVWRSEAVSVEQMRAQLQCFQKTEKADVAGQGMLPLDSADSGSRTVSGHDVSLQGAAPDENAMLTELLLKQGLGVLGVHAISKPMQKAGVTVHRVLLDNDRVMWLCFQPYNEGLKDEIVKARPAQVVLLNSCFAGEDADQQLSNLQLELAEQDIGLLIV